MESLPSIKALAKRLDLSGDDLIARLRLLGVQVTDASQLLDASTLRFIVSRDRTPTSASARFFFTCDSCGVQIESALPLPSGEPIYCADCFGQGAGWSCLDSDEELPDNYYKNFGASVEGFAAVSDEHLIATLREAIMVRTVADEIFIVHGHDPIKHEVASFVRSLGIIPIMLDERPNRGLTILEKLEEQSEAPFALVLLTPDDVGGKRGQRQQSPRARQNVMLELGYFLASLGRHRLCAMYVPGVELPSDIYGLLYIELDPKGGWKYRLTTELRAAGIMMISEGTS